MSIRAVICDIYNTLLEVGPPPANAESLWDDLRRQFGLAASPLSLAGFDAQCREAIRRAHAAAKAGGLAFPEVCWPEITASVLPELASWPEERRDEFLFRHAQLQRSIQPLPGAVETLEALLRQSVILGLCSNCQGYTLHEMRRAFAGTSLTLDWFHPQLRFLSFQQGYGKPAPAAFQQLRESLQAMGIAPAETLMVGDRLDNDILPAQAVGWQTWLLSDKAPLPAGGGEWRHLLKFPGLQVIGDRR